MSAVPASLLPASSASMPSIGIPSVTSTLQPAAAQPAAIAGTCDFIDPTGRVPGAGQYRPDQSVGSTPSPLPAPASKPSGSLDVISLGASGSFGAGSGSVSLQADLRTGDLYGCYGYSLGPSTPGIGASAQAGTALGTDGNEVTSTDGRRAIIGGDSQTTDGGLAVFGGSRSSNSDGVVNSIGLQTPGAGVQSGNSSCARLTSDGSDFETRAAANPIPDGTFINGGP